MEVKTIIPHLFRTEYSKIVAVLCAKFGFDHIGIAEDLASETFTAALESWPYHGVPENPAAWLYVVAKNKAKNYFQRVSNYQQIVLPNVAIPEISHTDIEIDLSDEHIKDAQLQMMFAVCHPAISQESQIGLALSILCGFSREEIANALLSNKETITKRLYRAREKLKEAGVTLEFPSKQELTTRIETVLTTLYLLYNEGYYSESHENVLREDLCFEAMRLITILSEHSSTNLPKTNALLALMYFHASRFNARKNALGQLILYADQDTSLWDQKLIAKGAHHLHLASVGEGLSKYHVEASIAYWFTVTDNQPEKWQHILDLYDLLLKFSTSPIYKLNCLFAYSKVYGNKSAIQEAEKLDIIGSPYYHALLGELYLSVNSGPAKVHFENALFYAKTQAEKESIRRKIDSLAATIKGL